MPDDYVPPADAPVGGSPILFRPSTFARHTKAVQMVEGANRALYPRAPRGRTTHPAPGAWGFLASGHTISGASGLTLGSGTVTLCSRDGGALTADGDDVQVLNSGAAISGPQTLELDWTDGAFAVCVCGSVPLLCVPCSPCGKIPLANEGTVTDANGTHPLVFADGQWGTGAIFWHVDHGCSLGLGCDFAGNTSYAYTYNCVPGEAVATLTMIRQFCECPDGSLQYAIVAPSEAFPTPVDATPTSCNPLQTSHAFFDGFPSTFANVSIPLSDGSELACCDPFPMPRRDLIFTVPPADALTLSYHAISNQWIYKFGGSPDPSQWIIIGCAGELSYGGCSENVSDNCYTELVDFTADPFHMHFQLFNNPCAGSPAGDCWSTTDMYID